jgi:predicted nucleic acid-binding protein
MLFLFDTNIVLIFLRNIVMKHKIESRYQPFNLNNSSMISVVTVGELKAFALKNKWGKSRIRDLEEFLLRFLIIDINTRDIINRYAEIDAFSQGRLDGRKSNFTARNMGKNDVWIAATASVLDAALLTTDNDFDHLRDEFLTLEKIGLSEII